MFCHSILDQSNSHDGGVQLEAKRVWSKRQPAIRQRSSFNDETADMSIVHPFTRHLQVDAKKPRVITVEVSADFSYLIKKFHKGLPTSDDVPAAEELLAKGWSFAEFRFIRLLCSARCHRVRIQR